MILKLNNKEKIAGLDSIQGRAVNDKKKTEELNAFYKKIFKEDISTSPTEMQVEQPLISLQITEDVEQFH